MAWYNFLKAVPDRNSRDQPASPTKTWTDSKLPVIEYRQLILAHEAVRHPVIMRVLNKIATAVQAVDWYVEADPNVVATKRASVSVINKLNDLLQSPSDELSADNLRYWLALSKAVYGRVPFKVGVATGGVANGIYPLEACYVKTTVNSRGILAGFEYEPSATVAKETLPTRKLAQAGKPYAYEIFTPNLTGRHEAKQSTSMLDSLGLPAQVVNLLLRRAVDTASGHPNSRYIVAAEKTLTDPQKREIQEFAAQAEPGAEESGHVLFIYNTTVQVHKLDNDLSDIHSKMPMDDMARMIAGAYGVPISLLGLGAADGAKFAGNFQESRQSFYEDTIDPGYLSPIELGMTAAICPPGARVRFDRDTIPALQFARAAKAKELKDVPFLDDDEKRELCGYPPRKPPVATPPDDD